MSYKETLLFSPNLNNWDNVLKELSILLSKFQIQKKTIFDYYNNLSEIDLKKMQLNSDLVSWLNNSYGINLFNIAATKLPAKLELSQNTLLNIDEVNHTISWVHNDPIKHDDILSILAYIENHRVWVKSYAIYTIKINNKIQTKRTFGLKNSLYLKFNKNHQFEDF